MKKIILILFSFAVYNIVYAGIYSASISYKHLQYRKYEFYVNVYKDTVTTSPSSLLINIGNEIDTLYKYKQIISGAYIQIFYKGIHNFNVDGSYLVVTDFSNRINGIWNIPNSINKGLTVESYININPFIGSNSSANDSIHLIVSAIVNQPFSVNLSSNDIDGDSLSYKLKPCRGANGNPIPGYTYPAQPPIFTLDSITGILTWSSPQNQGNYSVLVQIEEWRSGSLISYTEREHFIVVNLESGINTQDKSEEKVDALVYPNPASNQITIEFENQINSSDITIFNIIGQTIMKQNMSGNTKYNLNISNLESGMYFYSIFSDGKVLKSGKLIKQ